MKRNFQWFLYTAILLFVLYSCENANIEDKYFKGGKPTDTTENPHGNLSEIVWLPLNGNLNDSTGNNTPVVLVGNKKFVNGMNKDYGNGLYLDGNSYLLINLGYYDTLSIAFWIKGDGALESTNKPVLFDYGLNAITAQLDATTGATSLTLKKNENIANSSENSSVEYLNSFNRHSFVCVEAGGNNTKIYYKGYASGGTETIYSENLAFPGIIEAESDILYIGRSSQRENQSSTFFKGTIDEIHIYNKTLSDTEIENMALIPTN